MVEGSAAFLGVLRCECPPLPSVALPTKRGPHPPRPKLTPDGPDDVVMEVTLPFWIEPADVGVVFSETGVDVMVRNTLHVSRTFWRNE